MTYDHDTAVMLFAALCLMWAGLGGVCILSTWREGDTRAALTNGLLTLVGLAIFSTAWL